MATVLFALPIKPGQADAVRTLTKACIGQRRPEFDASERRIGIQVENWYLQHTPSGELFAFQVEGPDLQSSFGAFIASQDPFDLWFKEQVSVLTGVDLNAGPPPAEMIAETLGEYKAA
jgi:hypothetical protein